VVTPFTKKEVKRAAIKDETPATSKNACSHFFIFLSDSAEVKKMPDMGTREPTAYVARNQNKSLIETDKRLVRHQQERTNPK
jgi:hypothetical protein